MGDREAVQVLIFIFAVLVSDTSSAEVSSCCFIAVPETRLSVPVNATAEFNCTAPPGATGLVWLIDGESADGNDSAINILPIISNMNGLNAAIEITALPQTDNISVSCRYRNRDNDTAPCISSAGQLHIEASSNISIAVIPTPAPTSPVTTVSTSSVHSSVITPVATTALRTPMPTNTLQPDGENDGNGDGNLSDRKIAAIVGGIILMIILSIAAVVVVVLLLVVCLKRCSKAGNVDEGGESTSGDTRTPSEVTKL